MKETRLDKHGNISSLLTGKGKRTILTILEVLALQGNKTAWQLTESMLKTLKGFEPSYKEVQSYYSTIHKDLVKLLQFDYAAQQGSVRHSTHKKEEMLPLYGLTTKGLMVTMVVSEKVRQNWQEWAKNAINDIKQNHPEALDWSKLVSLLIQYGASQELFLKFFVNPNERLVTSMYNMDAVDGQTFWNACLEKLILTFEEGKFDSMKNLSQKDKAILMKIYQDSTVKRIREYYLNFLKQNYSDKLQYVKRLRV